MNDTITRRIEEVPKREVIYIDVGDMTPKDAENYINLIRGNYTTKKPSRFIRFMDFIGWMAYFGAFI